VLVEPPAGRLGQRGDRGHPRGAFVVHDTSLEATLVIETVTTLRRGNRSGLREARSGLT
jgi:hypothetical protein